VLVLCRWSHDGIGIVKAGACDIIGTKIAELENFAQVFILKVC